MNSNVVDLKRGDTSMKKASASVRADMDTQLLTVVDLDGWKPGPFQRPLKTTKRVIEVAEKIKENGGVIPGVLTLGTVGSNPTTYVIDGQHRIEAARLSDLREFIADVRVMGFDSMADMAIEYVELNSHIVNMQPDNLLKGLEMTIPALQVIRRSCDFVGYDSVRRNANSCLLSMSVALRCWRGANLDLPNIKSTSAVELARGTDVHSAEQMCQFLNVVRGSWGSDLEYARMWGTLNLTLCGWLWVHQVLTEPTRNERYTRLTVQQFSKVMMALSADSGYIDWLAGRKISERDRAPCYTRIRQIGATRLREDGIETVRFPQPIWSTERKSDTRTSK